MTLYSHREWLDKIYTERKERTIEITRKSIELLLNKKEKISLNSIVKISHEVDIKGISHSAILRNPEAKQLYETYRSWNKAKKNVTNKKSEDFYNLHIKSGRDFNGIFKRYSKLTKNQLIERLAIVEEAYAMLHKKWLEQQSELLEKQKL
ncbi:hypothetical protein F971_00808 [Acinetobacter vivianii]|uniref:Uncharacterized protein n=1 Tax=Acinetobacter vivianii TaxID=1776742 RepID=N8V1T4_9GAMM|nr:hypothetical protein [Acinetobacter vivianii]ENU93550.1 hypothetical protein F971_00808 [Acinetobacter vivianii]